MLSVTKVASCSLPFSCNVCCPFDAFLGNLFPSEAMSEADSYQQVTEWPVCLILPVALRERPVLNVLT